MNKQDVTLTDIIKAIKNREFEPYYHQIVDEDGIYGAEALSRWHSEKFDKTLSPFFFIGIVNENFEASELFGKLMYDKVLEDLVEMIEVGYDKFISFNLSASDLSSEGSVVNYILEKTPKELIRHIKLEVTQQHPIKMGHHEVSINKILTLKNAGFGIIMDDMGSARGFSVFDLLAEHVDMIKIDKSFADNMANKDGVELARPVTSIKGLIKATRSLSRDDIVIILEGVENGPQGETQKEILQREDLGFIKIQGFINGFPVNKKSFIKKILK